MSGGGYPKFKNDRGVPEICIGVKEFMCIGESPPQDHPHVYINMGEANTHISWPNSFRASLASRLAKAALF
jgi:uncharacterized Zn-finger protein